MSQKIIGVLFILLALLGLASLFAVPGIFSVKTESQKISQDSGFKAPLDINVRWKKDFQQLIKEGKIPKAWMSIREVRYIPLDEPLKVLVPKLNAPVSPTPDGDFALEITLMSHVSDEGETLIIFQHNIIDLENNNTLWEMNRTYPLISKE